MGEAALVLVLGAVDAASVLEMGVEKELELAEW